MARSTLNPKAVFDTALAEFNAGNLTKAARTARKLCKIVPNEASAWELRSAIAMAAGAYRDAVKLLMRAYRLNPANTNVLNNLGGAFRQLENAPEAAGYYEKSLAINPNQPNTCYNLGSVYSAMDELDAAHRTLRAGLELRSDDAEMRLMLAAVLMKQGESEAAQREYLRLLEQRPEDPVVRHGLYLSLARMGRLDEAEVELENLLAIAGDNPKYHFDGSILYLMKGQWLRGWKAYARRWEQNPGSKRPFEQPWWTGENLAEQTLLVWGDQGLGDEIMFASMIPDLASKVGDVVLELDERNVPLFERSLPNVRCIGRTDPPADEAMAADFQIPLSDLGIYLRTREEDFKGGAPYLTADREKAERLRQVYAELDGGGAGNLLVGVTWKSLNAQIGDSKSIFLDKMAPILTLPGITFLDLQYGDVTEERERFEAEYGTRIHKDPDIDPMLDLDGHAAQIAAMDLIISISNTSVHMAGALGVPTWLLAQELPDRRWLLGRDDSPWYGSVRIFRQDQQGDWSGPVARIAEALAEKQAAKRGETI